MFHNGQINIDDTQLDYISFGKGKDVFVMIPGAGDGFKTVKGTAFLFSLIYRKLSKYFTVYAFSRKNKMPEGYTNRDMAKELKVAFDKLGISKAKVLGVSQGGMIAQWLAIDYPEVVEKLVLCVTCAELSDNVRPVITSWAEWAKQEDYKSIFIDISEKSYTEKKLKRYRKWLPLLAKLTAPTSFERFLIGVNACLAQDSLGELEKITCPTLVIGGEQDKIVDGEASRILASKISAAKLLMYEKYGHGLYEEAKDFIDKVLEFFTDQL